VKKQHHTVKYELVCFLPAESSQIIWINGPYKGSIHDITIAHDQLLDHLLEGECLLGDKGYVGDSHFVTPFKPAVSHEQCCFNKEVYTHRQSIERIIKRIKIFRSVKDVWQHDVELHKFVFHVVAQITNINLIEKPLTKQ
jgi:hypothetical protein